MENICEADKFVKAQAKMKMFSRRQDEQFGDPMTHLVPTNSIKKSV